MIRFSLLRALAVGVCMLLGFPIFPEHPAWAALTVGLVVRPPARSIVVTGASRAIGTLAGGAPGVADVVVSGGSAVGLLADFIAAASLLVATMSVNCTVFPCFLTALIVLSEGLAREAALTVGWYRLLATLLGVGFAFLVIVVWVLIADRRDPVPQGPGSSAAVTLVREAMDAPTVRHRAGWQVRTSDIPPHTGQPVTYLRTLCILPATDLRHWHCADMHNSGSSRGTPGRRLVPSRSGDAVRLLIGALAAALVAGLLPLAAGTAAAATAAAVPVPTVELPDQVDIIDDYQGQQLCDPTPKPGTLQLRDTLWRTYGRDLWAGISRDCNATWDRGISEHKDGRAIDWGVSVRNDSRALGDAFARWATANNGENARRAGIMYLIWDSKMWRTYGMARGWTEYSSCQSRYTSSSYDTSCHRDHMHISMTWHGAGADTSWYDGTAVLLDDCRAGDPVARDPGSPAKPSVLFDPLAGQGTRQPCYLDSSIQAIRVPGPGKGVELQQRIRVTKLSVNAPAPVAIWTSAGSRVSLSPGSATPQEHVLTLGGDGTIYFQLPVGQAGLRVEGLGQVDSGRIGAGQVLEIPITGSRTGVPADAEAVSLNVTVTQPAAAGYVTVFPCAAARPTTSTLNFAAGQTVANSVIVGVGAGGKVCAYSTARTHIVADYAGYFPKGSAFTAVQPKRLRDTRGSADKPGRGTDVVVRVPDGAGAAALTITVTQPEADGWVAAYPCGAFSLSSSVNFRAGQTVPNSVIAKVGSGGTVCVRLSTATHVIVDMTGAMPDGAGYSSLSPQRLRDTRIVPGSPAAAGSDVVVAAPRGAAAVAVNLTVTGSSAGGWVLAYPCGSAVPNSSSVNFGPGQTVANGALVRVGEGGKVCVRGSTSTHVIVDVSGVFAPGTSFYRPATPVRAIDTRR